MRLNDETCFYHPDTGSDLDCDKCLKHICIRDKRPYRKKIGGGIYTSYTLRNYCIFCYVDQIHSDLFRQFKYLLLIPLLLILFIFTFYTDHNFFVGIRNLLAMFIIFIVFPLFIVGGILSKYFKVRKADDELHDYKLANLTSKLDKTIYCYYHQDKIAITICKRCNNPICIEDKRKLRKDSKDDYCISCYTKILQKRKNPLIYIGLVIIFESMLVVLGISNNILTQSLIYQIFFVIIGLFLILINVISYIYLNKKIKQSENDILISNESKISKLDNQQEGLKTIYSANNPLICIKCGSLLNLNDKKCPNCGYSTKD